MQGDAGALVGTPASKALCWGLSAPGASVSSLEVRRLVLGLLRTELLTAALLRTAMRVARAGLCATKGMHSTQKRGRIRRNFAVWGELFSGRFLPQSGTDRLD